MYVVLICILVTKKLSICPSICVCVCVSRKKCTCSVFTSTYKIYHQTYYSFDVSTHHCYFVIIFHAQGGKQSNQKHRNNKVQKVVPSIVSLKWIKTALKMKPISKMCCICRLDTPNLIDLKYKDVAKRTLCKLNEFIDLNVSKISVFTCYDQIIHEISISSGILFL